MKKKSPGTSGRAPADRGHKKTPPHPARGKKKTTPHSGKSRKTDDASSEFPSADDIAAFIAESDRPLTRREIARAFDITGQDRTRLRQVLRDIETRGISRTPGKTYKANSDLPERALLVITGIDDDGELLAAPLDWPASIDPPTIYVIAPKKSAADLSIGAHVLARTKKMSPGIYEARPLTGADGLSGDAATLRVVGVFKNMAKGGFVYPTNKKIKEDFFIPPDLQGDAHDGDLVIVSPLPPGSPYPRHKNPARIVERIGAKDDPRLISLIAIHSHGIPTDFPVSAVTEADKLTEPDLSHGREDLRHIPFVTIDGADARDFDDAVYTEPDDDAANPGGWKIAVAIADVSFYVRPGSALDREAFKRGNSTYFADRVVPMLPEQLSNDLCSLRPQVNRAALVAHMVIDKDARLRQWRFQRGLIRSAARLTYEQVEDAHLGQADDTTRPLLDTVIKPLYAAYSVMKHAREKRGALSLDLPERKAIIDNTGHIAAIIPRQRLASHQLIEEFMILANVAAAHALEDKNAPCVYRIHDSPAADRLLATREFLKDFGYSLPKGDNVHPRDLNRILALSADKPDKDLVHTLLLRTQSQAVYSPENIGHFGLALDRYAHFTSPIRRYADLLVHRALAKAYGLGPGGLTTDEADRMAELAEHISTTERRSMLAERDVMDRFTAQYLSRNIGQTFMGKISSVTSFGMFVSLDESGADGIVPMRHLPRDYYMYDETRHTLTGRERGLVFRLMDRVVVRLIEADPMRASTVFEVVAGEGEASSAPRHPRRGHKDTRGRGARHGRAARKNHEEGRADKGGQRKKGKGKDKRKGSGKDTRGDTKKGGPKNRR